MGELKCQNLVDGIGSGGCLAAPLLSKFTAFHPSLESQSFASLADFKDEDKWKEFIFGKEIFPLIPFEESESKTTEATEVTTSAGNIFVQDEGKYGVMFKMALTPDQNRILLTYNNKRFHFYAIDNNRTIFGTSPDGTSVTGFSGKMTVYKKDLPMTSEIVEFSVVMIMFDDIYEFNRNPRYAIGAELDWTPKQVIKPMTKITLTCGTVAANEFTCVAAYVDPTTGKSVPYTGMENDDTVVLDQNGDTVTATITPSTETDGTYAIAGTMTSGSITLNASADNLNYSDTTTVDAA